MLLFNIFDVIVLIAAAFALVMAITLLMKASRNKADFCPRCFFADPGICLVVYGYPVGSCIRGGYL